MCQPGVWAAAARLAAEITLVPGAAGAKLAAVEETTQGTQRLALQTRVLWLGMEFGAFPIEPAPGNFPLKKNGPFCRLGWPRRGILSVSAMEPGHRVLNYRGRLCEVGLENLRLAA